jgi:hypothetical protein
VSCSCYARRYIAKTACACFAKLCTGVVVPECLEALQAPEKWAKTAAEQDQQDTATSAQAGSHLGQSQQARRPPSVQGKSKGTDGSKSHTLLGRDQPGDAVVSSLHNGSDGGSNEASLGLAKPAGADVIGGAGAGAALEAGVSSSPDVEAKGGGA